MLADYRELIEQGVVYTLNDEDKLAGVLVIWPVDDAMLIENIAIHPDYQRRGIGQVLMDYAEQKARDVGLNMMRLYTGEKMTYNQDYYRKLGYVQTRLVVNDKGHRIVWMHKALA
jgi:ribosomal protein S18 acetylase RimI-like enzyme